MSILLETTEGLRKQTPERKWAKKSEGANIYLRPRTYFRIKRNRIFCQFGINYSILSFESHAHSPLTLLQNLFPRRLPFQTSFNKSLENFEIHYSAQGTIRDIAIQASSQTLPRLSGPLFPVFLRKC